MLSLHESFLALPLQDREGWDSYPHLTDEEPKVREDQDQAGKDTEKEAEAPGKAPNSGPMRWGEPIFEPLWISYATFGEWLNLSVLVPSSVKWEY